MNGDSLFEWLEQTLVDDARETGQRFPADGDVVRARVVGGG
jgi:hypothetical protein